MTTKQIGNIGEATALASFVKWGIPVYVPFGDNEKADLIAEFNGKLQKIQVKTSEKVENDKFAFNLASSTMHRKNGVRHIYTEDEVDFFCLFNLEMDVLLLIPRELVDGQTGITFKCVWAPSRNQFKALNWKDYTFEKWFKKDE